MIVRYAVAIAAGSAVTFGLLFAMQLMILTGKEALTETRSVGVVDFVRVERDAVIETKHRKPDKPPPPELRPELPAPAIANPFDTGLAVAISEPAIELSVGVGGVGFGIADGEYLPIVKVAPVYPARARARRLEGYVMVEFTVTETGSVKDVAVVESTASLFEEAAVEAALKFKYKPRVINGQPVEVPGVRNKIVFSVERA